jgi:TusA-related sulfurtransferase
MIEIDVRGLSCPEPVLLTLDALDENKGSDIKVIGDEAHTRKNIERALKYQKVSFNTVDKGSEFEITFKA